MQFTLRQIQIFVAVCDSGSVTGAAADLHIAQSAVSTSIRNLERALKVSLFVRSHAANVVPTPYGREVLVRGRELLQSAGDLESFAGSLIDTISGRVDVGFLVTIAPVVMPQIIRAFADDHPGASISPIETNQFELIRLLRSGEIGIAVTYDLGMEHGLVFTPLLDVPPLAIVSRENPVADQPHATLQQLSGMPLILLDLPLSSDYFIGLFRYAGLEPMIGHRTRQMDVVRSMVGQNLGYSLINMRPSTNLSMDGHELVAVPVHCPSPPLRFGYATVRGQIRTASLRAFIDTLSRWCSTRHAD